MAGAWRRLQLAGASLVPLVFTASWAVSEALQTDYSPRREDLSALAATDSEHAWIMIAGLVVTGSLIVVLAPAVSRGSSLEPALVALGGLGVIGLGLLRNDCSTRTASCEARVDAGDVSWHHTAHDVLSIPVFVLAVALPVVIAVRFRRDRRLRGLAPVSTATSVVLAGLFVAGGLDAAPGWHGVVQRTAVTIALLWLGWVALRLLRCGSSVRGA